MQPWATLVVAGKNPGPLALNDSPAYVNCDHSQGWSQIWSLLSWLDNAFPKAWSWEKEWSHQWLWAWFVITPWSQNNLTGTAFLKGKTWILKKLSGNTLTWVCLSCYFAPLGKKRINMVGHQLQMNQHCIDTAYNFYKLAVNKRLTRGRRINNIVTACLYLVCRTERTPRIL